MKRYRVILTWEAICDITDAADYIEEKFGEKIANRFLSDIKKQMVELETTGSFWGKTSVYLREYPVYKKLMLPSIIFYIIKENQKEIHVLRVLREEKDWKNILRIHSNYTYPISDSE